MYMFDVMWEDGWLPFSYIYIYTSVVTSYTSVLRPRKNAKWTPGQEVVSNGQLCLTGKNTLIANVNFTLSRKYHFENRFVWMF